MERITLPIHGEEREFTREQLSAILEKIFPKNVPGVPTGPKQGEEFEVDYDAIKWDRIDFIMRRTDPEQEKGRRAMLDAKAEMERNPGQCPRKFKVLLTGEVLGKIKNEKEIIRRANARGAEAQTVLMYCLENAMRISNGEPWEAVFNKPDTAMYSRVLIGKDGRPYKAGGSIIAEDSSPAGKLENRWHANVFDFIQSQLVVVYDVDEHCY